MKKLSNHDFIAVTGGDHIQRCIFDDYDDFKFEHGDELSIISRQGVSPPVTLAKNLIAPIDLTL